jgi:Flp pilus assembly protein TadB
MIFAALKRTFITEIITDVIWLAAVALLAAIGISGTLPQWVGVIAGIALAATAYHWLFRRPYKRRLRAQRELG